MKKRCKQSVENTRTRGPDVGRENEWFIRELQNRGYTEREAREMLAQDLANAAEEDGM